MRPKPFTILNYMMLVVFLLCVLVQFNDPDAGILPQLELNQLD